MNQTTAYLFNYFIHDVHLSRHGTGLWQTERQTRHPQLRRAMHIAVLVLWRTSTSYTSVR